MARMLGRALASMQLQNVLVCLDFSKPSTEALREAHRICQWNKARLTALYVIDREASSALAADVAHASLASKHDLKDQIRSAAEKRVAHFVRQVLGEEVSFEAVSVVGQPHQAILDAVPRYQASLLVLGNSGHGKGSSRIGTIAKRAVRRAPCNVLVVRGEQEGPFRHVVTGIDFSANSEKAARQAVHFAQQDDAYLEFVHIVPPVDSLVETLRFSAPLIPLISDTLEKSFNDEIETALYKFVKPIVKRMGGVEQFKVRVRRAHPVRNGILSSSKPPSPIWWSWERKVRQDCALFG